MPVRINGATPLFCCACSEALCEVGSSGETAEASSARVGGVEATCPNPANPERKSIATMATATVRGANLLLPKSETCRKLWNESV